jgi:hypothetical protein
MAIIIDYRGDMESSVTIFNRRIRATDSTRYEERDWPWRYAKMCAQSSDWLRHEVTIHLTNTHLIEEAVIVSAHRTLRPDHPVFQVMKEHWATTLSVNWGARATLIPGVILPLAGIGGPQMVQFLNHAYESFDWKSLYIPHDLNSRGFPMLALEHDPKFRNYVYGRNMSLMWPVLRKFVASHISKAYEGRDSNVVADAELSAFCAEMRGAARITSFPDVKTVEDLIDMVNSVSLHLMIPIDQIFSQVTMCIHIAAPQHTAVNYLQVNQRSYHSTSKPTDRIRCSSITTRCLFRTSPLHYISHYQKHSMTYLLSMRSTSLDLSQVSRTSRIGSLPPFCPSCSHRR